MSRCNCRPGLLRFARITCWARWCAAWDWRWSKPQAAFEPESGAYGGHGGHAHGHSADGEGRGARIHDMMLKQRAS